MKLTIAHKIIISICGVLAFAFLNSAFAIYSEYTAAKTSEIIGRNYINAYKQMETLSLNTLTRKKMQMIINHLLQQKKIKNII